MTNIMYEYIRSSNGRNANNVFAGSCSLHTGIGMAIYMNTRTIKSGKSGVLMKLYKENLSNIELGQAADYFISLLLRFYV